jgi:hypothetical protein
VDSQLKQAIAALGGFESVALVLFAVSQWADSGPSIDAHGIVNLISMTAIGCAISGPAVAVWLAREYLSERFK